MDGWLRLVALSYLGQFSGIIPLKPALARAHLYQLYREIDKRSANRSKTDQEPTEPQDTDPPRKGKPSAAQALTQGLDKHRERLLLGSLTNSHKFKVDGMIKKVGSPFLR